MPVAQEVAQARLDGQLELRPSARVPPSEPTSQVAARRPRSRAVRGCGRKGEGEGWHGPSAAFASEWKPGPGRPPIGAWAHSQGNEGGGGAAREQPTRPSSSTA